MTCTTLKSKRRLLILGLGLTGLLALPAAAADPAAAKATVDTVVAEALAALRDDSLTQPQKQDRIEKLAEQRFDFPVITKLVLARNWKKLSEDQRAEFLVEFKRHLSLTYGRRLGRFSDEDVVVGDTQGHSNGDVTVKTSIVGGEANGVTLDYRMRERDGNWYAIDVIIEGVSMISNFRSQIQEIVSTSGPEGLINALREKNEAEAAEPADT